MQDASAVDAAIQLAAVLEASDNPIIFTDERGIVTRWNTAAREFYGYSAAEVIGTSTRSAAARTARSFRSR
jgi:PAS domain S-box-containing protein